MKQVPQFLPVKVIVGQIEHAHNWVSGKTTDTLDLIQCVRVCLWVGDCICVLVC